MTKLKDMVGNSFDDDFMEFDLTEIQEVLLTLKNIEPIDLAHAERLQQQALRGADIASEYLGRIVKVAAYLKNKVNSAKNKAALEYKANEGRTTAEMKKWAGDCSPEVEQWQEKLAKAEGSKSFIENKFEILIKAHHHYKDIAAGLRKTIVKEW